MAIVIVFLLRDHVYLKIAHDDSNGVIKSTLDAKVIFFFLG